MQFHHLFDSKFRLDKPKPLDHARNDPQLGRRQSTTTREHSDAVALGSIKAALELTSHGTEKMAGEDDKEAKVDGAGPVRLSTASTLSGSEPKQSWSEVTPPQEQPIRSEAIKVPRSRRRGLFGRFSVLAEVEEPRKYPRKSKWFITFTVAMGGIAAPLGSAIIFRKS